MTVGLNKDPPPLFIQGKTGSECRTRDKQTPCCDVVIFHICFINMSVLFTLQQFILVLFLLFTVLFYISTPLQMMFQPQWFLKGSLVLVIWSSVLSGSDHLDVLIIRSGRSVLCQVWSSWYSSIREVPRQLWRCTSSPSGCLLSSCWWDRQKLTSGLLMSVIKQLTLQTGPGPEFTQLMLIHRKVLKLLQSNFTVVCENVFMSIDELSSKARHHSVRPVLSL